MISRLTSRLIAPSGLIRLAVSMVCFGTILLVTATNAFATCGDYLHSKNMRGHQQAMPGHHLPQQEGPAAARTEQSSLPMSTPCQGPQCQKRDPSPLTPGPVPVKFVTRSMTEALLTPTAELNLVSRAVAYREAALNASEGFVERLERPPRS